MSVSAPASIDHELVESCRRGDRNALDVVLKRAMPKLQRLLSRLVGPGPDADDLLELTLVAAMEAFPGYRGQASLDRWLSGIATRVVYRHFRHAQVRRHASLELLVGGAEPRDPNPLPDLAATNRRRVERIYYHLDRLSAKSRLAFLLYFLEGHAIDEVASIMEANPITTKTRIFMARRSLLARARKDPALKELFESGAIA